MSYIHSFRNAKQKHLYTSLCFCLILSISVSALIEPPSSSPKHDDRSEIYFGMSHSVALKVVFGMLMALVAVLALVMLDLLQCPLRSFNHKVMLLMFSFFSFLFFVFSLQYKKTLSYYYMIFFRGFGAMYVHLCLMILSIIQFRIMQVLVPLQEDQKHFCTCLA